jgi:hypothetical protein
VLLTIGGTGPNWIPDPVHPVPDVPPVGFHWSVGSGVVVKGESYFAITPRQLAFGGRLEATGEFGPVRVWFEVHLNVDIEWDPLHYHLDAGISIGAELRFTIDLLFTSITIDITISIGGSVVVEGPPLHGSVTVDLEIASVTVDFGHAISPPGLSWPEFAAKFVGLLGPPNADDTATGEKSSIGTITYGQLADSTKGPGNAGEHPDGSHDKPWKVLPEFGIDVASQLPLTTVTMAGRSTPSGADPRPPDLEGGTFSIKPMGSAGGLYRAHLEIRVRASGAGGWTDVDVSGVQLSPRYGHYPTAVWLVGGKEPPTQHRDMWLTVSGAGLAFPVTFREDSHALGESASIPVATLVEELPPRPLPFVTAPHALRHTELPVAEHAPADRVVAEPRLLATTHRQRPPVARTHRIGTADHGRLAALVGRAPGAAASEEAQVGPGEAHLWAAPYGGGTFEGRGDGDVRVTTLSATGHLLDDRSGPARSLRFDTNEHGDRVVVSALGSPASVDAGVAGWQSGSMLTQVAGDTLLGQGCALLLPRMVTAPHPAMTERRVRAARVMGGLSGVQTLLPGDVDVVVVLLDERAPGAADDVVVLAGTGHPGEGVLGAVHEVREGTRRCLVHPVQERTGTDRLAVTVASARGWRTAGVLGVRGDVEAWVARLTADPHPCLLTEPADGDAVGYALTSRRED